MLCYSQSPSHSFKSAPPLGNYFISPEEALGFIFLLFALQNLWFQFNESTKIRKLLFSMSFRFFSSLSRSLVFMLVMLFFLAVKQLILMIIFFFEHNVLLLVEFYEWIIWKSLGKFWTKYINWEVTVLYYFRSKVPVLHILQYIAPNLFNCGYWLDAIWPENGI
jgi:hypothetical protein